DWGDGQTTSGTVGTDPHIAGLFTVTGQHTYAVGGHLNLTVHIADQGGSMTTATGSAAVADTPVQVSVGTVNATEQVPFTGVVGPFAQTAAGPAGSYRAFINWGDGHTTNGTVTAVGPVTFQVSGTNTYAVGGTYPLRVSVVDAAGTNATAVGSA